MKKSILSGTLIIILSIGFINPLTTYAGDKEWATAGKVLTGIIAANVIGDFFVPERYAKVSSADYYRQSNYKCRPKRRPYKNNRYSEKITWKKPIRYRRGRRTERSYRTVTKCSDPIIVHIQKGRRIYQPRVKGATAYLQVYSKVCKEWVNVEEYPSLW